MSEILSSEDAGAIQIWYVGREGATEAVEGWLVSVTTLQATITVEGLTFPVPLSDVYASRPAAHKEVARRRNVDAEARKAAKARRGAFLKEMGNGSLDELVAARRRNVDAEEVLPPVLPEEELTKQAEIAAKKQDTQD